MEPVGGSVRPMGNRRGGRTALTDPAIRGGPPERQDSVQAPTSVREGRGRLAEPSLERTSDAFGISVRVREADDASAPYIRR